MPKPRFIPLLVLVAVAAGCQTVGKPVTGIANFALVEDGFYRGGQPSFEGIQQLKDKKVRTVIDLRDDKNPAERKWVEDAGMGEIQPLMLTRGRAPPYAVVMPTRTVRAASCAAVSVNVTVVGLLLAFHW